jgi:hypothetical protein
LYDTAVATPTKRNSTIAKILIALQNFFTGFSSKCLFHDHNGRLMHGERHPSKQANDREMILRDYAQCLKPTIRIDAPATSRWSLSINAIFLTASREVDPVFVLKNLPSMSCTAEGSAA